MDVAHPYLALLPKVSGSTLLVLSLTTGQLTGRKVARLAGASQPAVQAALTHPAEHGLVYVQPAGRAYLYSLNRDHVAIPAVAAALGMTTALVDKIRELVTSWRPANSRPKQLSIFGSTARADGDAHSDIDLFMVRPDAELEGLSVG
jgi:hypothetical protein